MSDTKENNGKNFLLKRYEVATSVWLGADLLAYEKK